MADSDFRCSWIPCNDPKLSRIAARVEVCTVLPSKVTKIERERFLIRWSRRGEAIFHPECWKVLLKCARARNERNLKVKFKSAAEKLMVKEAAKTVEQHDSKETIEQAADKIANILLSSSHCVAFTGAGISTSAGIGDYRGKSGKWTKDERATVSVVGEGDPDAKKQKCSSESDSDDEIDDEQHGVPYEDLRPTYTHEALCKLMNLDYVKYVISQNCDGLHTLSGIPDDKISELHGNVFKEKCDTCGHVYERSTYVLCDKSSQYYEDITQNGKTDLRRPPYAKQCPQCRLCHYTGRKCKQKGCSGWLRDTIINFSDDLDEEILARATNHAKLSDVMVCLGSTMTVTPACHLVEMGKQPLTLIICNRQKTALDDLCLEQDTKTKECRGVRVFGDCDVLMREIMQRVLSAEELETWQQEIKKKLSTYDRQRHA